MKKLTLLLSMIIAVAILSFGCSSDESTTPVPNTYSIGGTISDANGNGVGNISLNLTSTVTGDNKSTTTDAQGQYTFAGLTAESGGTVTPTADTYDFDPLSLNYGSIEQNITDFDFTAIGIYGTWVSEGSNVAPLLVSLFKVVKITATFNTNGSYTVTQEDSSGATLDLTGTFTVQKSDVGDIYNIVLDQTTPSVLTATGIYFIASLSTPMEMSYEVVQTTPDIGATPPTAEGGFGSTNGGALGTWNIQRYVRQ